MARTRSGKVYSIAPSPPTEDTSFETHLLSQASSKNPEVRSLSLLTYILYRIKKAENVRDKLKYSCIAEKVLLNGGSTTLGKTTVQNDTALLWVLAILGRITEKMLVTTEWARLHKNLTKLAHSIISLATNPTEFEHRNDAGVNAFFWVVYLLLPLRAWHIKSLSSFYGIAQHILHKYAKNKWSVANLELMWSPLRGCKTGKKYTTTTLLPPRMREFMNTECVY
jgi:hypothetical protein